MKAQHQHKRCACGCGETVTRQFVNGHDSKLRVAVVEALQDGHALRVYGRRYDPLEYSKRFGIYWQVRETMRARGIKHKVQRQTTAA